MGKYCLVKSCKSSTYVGKNKCSRECITWHRLPTDPALQKIWEKVMNVQSMPKDARICSKHFTLDCFTQSGFDKKRLKPNTIPSRYLDSHTDRDALPDSAPEGGRNDLTLKDENISACTADLATKRFKPNSKPPLHLQTNIPRDSLQEIIPENDRAKAEESSVVTQVTPQKSSVCNTVRYPGDLTDKKILNMSPKSIVKSMQMLKKVCNEKENRIRKLVRTQRIQKKKIESLQQLLADLRKSDLISPNAHDVLETMSPDNCDIIEVIERGKVKGKYPAHLRSFALTLHFYSPRAYEYVRRVFRNKLPASSTIRCWYSSTNGSPGITKEAIDMLKTKAEATPNKKIFGCLMDDEMAIRKQAEWNHPQKRFLGYVDFGTMIPEPEQLPLAKDALVYLVNAINERWKIPVAYFFVNGLTAKERAEITRKVLNVIAMAGIFIIALTFDGLPANIAMCSEMSADVFNNRPYFEHPSVPGLTVRILFDAAHMAKLARNLLASKRVIYDADNNSIQWEYIEKLVYLQEAACCHLANKVTRKHLNWEKNKMNVKLAVQTLSESVAIALQQLLNDKNKDFVGCAATIKFILMVNHTFDCLNSRSLHSCRYKRPITPTSAAEIFNFFDEAKLYFSQLKVERNGKPIIQTKLKTGFLGLIIDMQNFKDMYYDFVANGPMMYILSYKFSQDHLETFFSCIRSMGGYNNNPNAIQFTAAYKRLLHRNEVKSSAEANCVPLDRTNILTVSSRKTNIAVQPAEQDVDRILLDDLPLEYIDPLANHCTLYVAGFVERKVLQTIQCETCIRLLNECEPIKSSFISNKSFGSLRYPRLDTYRITSMTEKIINWYRNDGTITHKNIYNKIFLNTFRNINLDLVFTNFDDHTKDLECTENHKYYMIKLIVDYYVKVRISYYGEELTRREHSNYLRRVLNKTILFKGQ